MGEDTVYWIIGGVVVAAGILMFVFKDQICQHVPDLPLLCKSLPFTENPPTPTSTQVQGEVDSAVTPIIETCKNRCNGYIVGSSGWEDCMKACTASASIAAGSGSQQIGQL